MSALAIEQGTSTTPATIEANRPKPARYTGEILLRTRPKTYYKVIQMLAAGESVASVERQCKVSEHTINAIADRRAVDIAERKKTLVANLADVAELGSERMITLVGKSSLRDATIGTGVAVDKVLALLGQTAPVAQVAVIMPSDSDRAERRAMHDTLDRIAAKLNAPA